MTLLYLQPKLLQDRRLLACNSPFCVKKMSKNCPDDVSAGGQTPKSATLPANNIPFAMKLYAGGNIVQSINAGRDPHTPEKKIISIQGPLPST
jgi:hypothetical protein